MYVTEYNMDFMFVAPLIERYHSRINFKTTPFEEILDGPYFKEITKAAATNEYCIMKCNRHRDRIKEDLVLRDRKFSRDESARFTAAGSCLDTGSGTGLDRKKGHE